MKSKRSLMTMVVGLALLATPIAAAAKDHNRYDNSHAARVSRSFTPARNLPAAVTRREFHNNALAVPRDWREDHRGWKRGGGDADDYRNYRPAPAYVEPAYPVAAPYYGVAGNGGGQNCVKAQRIVNNYNRDRNTGHPAAAADLLRRNQWAFRSGCAGGSPYGGGLLGGLGGVPAYNNNGGYNGGYGQPYGTTSMLAPLIQQFVR